MSIRTLIGAHRAVEALLETLPETWQVMRFKSVFDRLDRRNVNLEYEMLSLRSTGEVVARAEMGGRQEPDDASLPRYLVAEIGDLVVNPMWLIGGGIGVSRRAGAVSPDYRVFKPRRSLTPQFIHYLLRSQPYLDQYLLYTRAQTTFDRRVQQPDLDNLPLPVPPLDEQRVIAGYLDRETARIDTLIEEQQCLIEMLRERRQSVIDRGVLGLGRAGSTPRATIGRHLAVEPLLARIPDGWQVKRFKIVLKRVEERNVDLTQPMMSLKVTGKLAPRAAGQQLPDDASLPRYLVARVGDLVVNPMWLTGGAVGVADVNGAVSPDYRVFRPTGSHHSRYLHHLLRSSPYRDQYVLYTRAKTTFDRRVQQPDLNNLPLPTPPITEQEEIAAEIDRQIAKIDSLIGETEGFIDLARERRAALITAAVAGQIDVREVT